MLNWWLGRPVNGAERVPGTDPDADAPETPAPVFAARALKSAFFGTPGLPQDDTLYGIDREDDTDAGRDNGQFQNPPISPTKPPGILMTPGTGTTRRKTVSFGSEVVDNEGRDGLQKGLPRAATPHSYPGKSLSPWISKTEELSQPNKKTALQQTLEDSRGTDSSFKKRNQFSTAHSILPSPSLVKDNDIVRSNVDMKEPRKSRSSEGLSKQFASNVDTDGDVTVDMNEPRSQSGRFWKSEFQRYHDEAQAQMTQLVRYKQLAKSYAKKKDAEALDLAEKLKEEQSKVAIMETNISELMMQVAEDGKVNGDASPEMMRDLARQTALAFQYRVQVEEFRKAVEGDGNLAAALPKIESRNSKDEPNDVASLREELEKAQQALAAVEKTASKLREENNKLSQDLLHSDLRFEKHTESCEKRLKLAEEQRHKKDERIRTLQKDYDHIKQVAKNSRRDAEHLLRKRHDQVVGLRKEIASLKSAQSTMEDLQQTLGQKTIKHDNIIEGYKRENGKLQEGMVASIYSNEKESGGLDLFRTTSNNSTDKNPALASGIPVSIRSIARPSRTVTSSRPAHSEAPPAAAISRSSYAALSEITNFAMDEKLAFQKSGKVDYTPLANRFSDLSLDSPNADLQYADPSLPLLPARTSHESRSMVSPRPKIFNIPSSPPRATVARSRAADQLKSSNEFTAPRQTAVTAGRLSSMNISKRCALPPDRVAAAKARLAQKNAEKRRARALGAENIR